ncbi:MAG: glycosyltransferase [Immundisolibacteraceae bacterium]|nr:glycosyltransferase [Immundisolibacteraceae bacterium]
MTKRVLLDLRNSYDSLRGISDEYLRALDPDQYRLITVLIRGRRPTELSVGDKVGIPADRVVFLEVPKKVFGWQFLAAWRLQRVCRQEGVEVIVAHRFKAHQVMGLLGLFNLRVAQVAVVHGLRHLASGWRKLFVALWLRQVHLVGVSQAVAEDISSELDCGLMPWWGRKVSVSALPNVIDVAAVRSNLLTKTDARQRLGVRADAYVIGHIGRLADSKDQVTLLRAFQVARSTIPKAHLVIIGDGRYRKVVHQAVDDLDLSDHVTLTGWLDNAAQYMAAFDQFALTSVEEAFGLVLLEAMIARLPMLATDVGGVAEVVGDCCRLLMPGDVESIAAEMVRLASLSSAELMALGEAMEARAGQKFDRPVLRQGLARLMKQIES